MYVCVYVCINLYLYIIISMCMCVCCSVMSDSLTPWTIQPMEFSRSGNWSGQPIPSPGYLPNPGIEPRFPALQANSLRAEPQGKPKNTRVGSLSLLQGNFLTQGLNLGLLHCRHIFYHLSHQGSHIHIYYLCLYLYPGSSQSETPGRVDNGPGVENRELLQQEVEYLILETLHSTLEFIFFKIPMTRNVHNHQVSQIYLTWCYQGLNHAPCIGGQIL